MAKCIQLPRRKRRDVATKVKSDSKQVIKKVPNKNNAKPKTAVVLEKVESSLQLGVLAGKTIYIELDSWNIQSSDHLKQILGRDTRKYVVKGVYGRYIKSRNTIFVTVPVYFDTTYVCDAKWVKKWGSTCRLESGKIELTNEFITEKATQLENCTGSSRLRDVAPRISNSINKIAEFRRTPRTSPSRLASTTSRGKATASTTEWKKSKARHQRSMSVSESRDTRILRSSISCRHSRRIANQVIRTPHRSNHHQQQQPQQQSGSRSKTTPPSQVDPMTTSSNSGSSSSRRWSRWSSSSSAAVTSGSASTSAHRYPCHLLLRKTSSRSNKNAVSPTKATVAVSGAGAVAVSNNEVIQSNSAIDSLFSYLQTDRNNEANVDSNADAATVVTLRTTATSMSSSCSDRATGHTAADSASAAAPSVSGSSAWDSNSYQVLLQRFLYPRQQQPAETAKR